MKIEIDGVDVQHPGVRHLKAARERQGLKQEDVAASLDASPHRVMYLELQDIGVLRLHTLEEYVEAIGGRLCLAVRFDGEGS